MTTNERELTDRDPLILGQWLREARRERGLTQEDAAEEVGIARTSLVAIEKGERRVRPAELLKLARIYGRKLDELMRPQPPLEGFAVQFRLPAYVDTESSEATSPITEFQRLVQDYLELERLTGDALPRQYPAAHDTEPIPPRAAGEQLSQVERSRLGLGDGPLLHLRELLENDVGIRIFYLPMPSKFAGLFGYTEEAGACVAINAQHPPERQRWSLAHEYGHFLTNRYRPEVTVLHAFERIPAAERLADSFAEHFLLPSAGITRRFAEAKRASQGTITPAHLLQLATFYGVSLPALAIRLESLRLLPSGTWDRLREARFKVHEAKRLMSIEPEASDVERFPTRYRLLAVHAYREGIITEGQFAHVLRVDRVTARGIAADLSKRQIITDAGQAAEIDVGFFEGDGRIAGSS